jgi:hypothetical protein
MEAEMASHVWTLRKLPVLSEVQGELENNRAQTKGAASTGRYFL